MRWIYHPPGIMFLGKWRAIRRTALLEDLSKRPPL